MTKPESITDLRPDFVYELIAPDVPYQPLGKDDSMSGYLYRPMVEAESTYRMIIFIDEVEGFIDTENVGEELDELKIHRTIALVADMPSELPEEQRLEVWKHLLSKDWVHKCGDNAVLERVLTKVHRENPQYAQAIMDVLIGVFKEKIEQIIAQTNEEAVQEVVAPDFDIHAVLERLSALERDYPELTDLYNSVVVLRMNIQGLPHLDQA